MVLLVNLHLFVHRDKISVVSIPSVNINQFTIYINHLSLALSL